jgi:hypothetical protein
MPRVNDGIMVDNYDPIASRVHVELDTVGPQLNGSLERCNGVLGMALVRPTVGDALRWSAVSVCGQAFLSVVALYSMSAKL